MKIMTPIEAAESVGMTTYDFDYLVRDQAAGRLENLAARIRRGNESDEGDVEAKDYDRIVSEVWYQVEAAKVLTADWTRDASA